MGIKIKALDAKEPKTGKRSMTRKQLMILLFSVAAVLLAAAVVVFLVVCNEGNIAAENAQELLAEYEKNLSLAAEAPMITEGAAAPLPSGTEVSAAVPEMTPYSGYEVIGKLVIGKINQELPVICETTRAALKMSCCYYEGPMPGEPGNLVITGHDYASGAIFGRLSELRAGDIVVLSTPANEYTYEVYETRVIRPDQAEALDEYEGDMALTLMTCTSHGNRRLLVYCRPLAGR